MKTIVISIFSLALFFSCSTQSRLEQDGNVTDSSLYQKYLQIKKNQKDLILEQKKTMFVYQGKSYPQDDFLALTKTTRLDTFKTITSIKDENKIKSLGFSTEKVNRVIVIN